MKISIFALSISLLMFSFSAQAFLSKSEQVQTLQKLNETFLSLEESVRFDDIRCSLRTRTCVVNFVLMNSNIKSGCLLEKISDSADIITKTRDTDNNETVEITNSTLRTLESCIDQFHQQATRRLQTF